MRKFRFLAAGTLALFMATVGGVGGGEILASQHGDGPISATMRVTEEGNLATFVILVKNERTSNIGILDIKGSVPEGTTLARTWAGSGPGNGPGRFTGGDRAVGWVHRNIGAGRTQGPFVFTLDTGGKKVCSFAWVRATQGVNSGTFKTADVCTD